MAPEAIVLAPGEGSSLSAHGAGFVLKAGAADTAGGFSVMERTIPASVKAPPQHVHAAAEAFYVLQGWITFHLGERVEAVGGGGFVMVPGGAPHTFSNESGSEARMLILHAPAMDEFYERFAALWAGEAKPTPEEERALQAEFGITPA